jgi:hypothetical protein
MFSLTASGTIGKTITMSKWKGRPYARTRVIPFNGRTAGQQLVRGALGVIAKAAKAVLTAAKDTLPGMGSQFFLDTLTHIPGTKSWVSALQANYGRTVTADAATFAALGAVAALYETAAGTASLTDYVTVGDTPVTYTAGFQLYTLAKFAAASLGYTGFAAGTNAATAPQLATFVDYVQTSI